MGRNGIKKGAGFFNLRRISMREELEKLRKENNISIQQISENICVDISKIEKIESGKRFRNDAVFYAYRYYILYSSLKNSLDNIRQECTNDYNNICHALEASLEELELVKKEIESSRKINRIDLSTEEDFKYIN